jgi:hypothetical protein
LSVKDPTSDDDKQKAYRTLRGFIAGHEPDEDNFFCFRASLRIFGENVPFDEISSRLGVQPTHRHRKGERRSPSHAGYSHDMWNYQSPLDKNEPLERHIEALWQVVKPAVEYLKELKSRFSVDVFCGYRSNCDHAGFEVSHRCLELFTALEVPFGVSVIIT